MDIFLVDLKFGHIRFYTLGLLPSTRYISSPSPYHLFVCLFVCGFVPYRQLELLAVEGLVPWVIICVCAGVTYCYSELLRAGVLLSELD